MLQRITHRKKNYVEFVKSKKKGLSTGFPSLDNLLYGLQPGYHILAARPSVGKTSFALNIAIQVAIAKKKPLFFSLEMTESQFMERLVSYLTGVSPMDLRTNNIKEDHKEAVDNVDKIINDMDMYVDYTSKHSAGSLLKQIQFLKEADGYVPDVIFVDYIQHMKTNDSRFPKNPSDYAEISRELCHISKELNFKYCIDM